MKYTIGLCFIVLVMGIGACGGGGTTTVVEKAAPPPAPTQTQPPEAKQTPEELLAEIIVKGYKPDDKECAAATGALSYQQAERAFEKGYLSTNPGNYPSATVMFDALVAYCEGPTA